MNKKICISLLLLATVPVLLQGQSTVNFDAAPGQRDVLYDGSALPDGNHVALGYFSGSLDVAANAENIGVLSGAWEEYGSTTIRTLFGQAGRFSASYSSTDPIFDNRQIMLWIFKTTDGLAPAANYANVEGYGIYSSTAINWRFPAQGSLPPANTTFINSSEITQALYGGFDSGHLYLSQVPEPTTLGLLALGVAPLAWNFLRRRNS
jgi:hypothetical protein